MNLLQLLLNGLFASLEISNVIIMLGAVIVGVIFGAAPGLTATMCVAILLPVSFGMNPLNALTMLVAAYCGAMYGGSIPAILLNAPGTPAAAATCIEGFPMARKGKAAEALSMAAFASWFGGTLGAIALFLIAPQLSKIALMFGPPEFFFLSILGLTIVISLSMDNLLKGITSGVIGLLFGTVGMDLMTAYPRFTLGFRELLDGLPLVPSLVGLLSITQILFLIEESESPILQAKMVISKGISLSLKEIRRLLKTLIKSSLLGILIGSFPGAGGTIATFLAYDYTKRSSKNPEKFGTGVIDGIAATESANNANIGGALVTTLTLGIPGNSTAAVLLGALIIHGLRPGPQFFMQTTDIAYAFMASFLIANLLMLVVGLFGARYFKNIVRCPNNILAVVVYSLAAVGCYSFRNSIFDVWLVFILGAFGYLVRKTGFNPVPIVLGIILGPIAERGLLRSIRLSGGDIVPYMLTRPICVLLIILIVISLSVPIMRRKKTKLNNIA